TDARPLTPHPPPAPGGGELELWSGPGQTDHYNPSLRVAVSRRRAGLNLGLLAAVVGAGARRGAGNGPAKRRGTSTSSDDSRGILRFVKSQLRATSYASSCATSHAAGRDHSARLSRLCRGGTVLPFRQLL